MNRHPFANWCMFALLAVAFWVAFWAAATLLTGVVN